MSLTDDVIIIDPSLLLFIELSVGVFVGWASTGDKVSAASGDVGAVFVTGKEEKEKKNIKLTTRSS